MYSNVSTKNNSPGARFRPGLRPVFTFILMCGLVGAATVVNSFARSEETRNSAQVSKETNVAADALRDAKKLIASQEWTKAAEKFKEIIAQTHGSEPADEALFWLAYVYKKQNSFREADKTLEQLIREFPQSIWVQDATTMRVEIAGRLGNRKLINQVTNKDDDEIRIVALQSLFNSDPEQGIAVATEILKPDSKSSGQMKEAAITLLGQLGGNRANSLLADVVKNDPDIKTRRAAVLWMGQTLDENVLPTLKDLAVNSKDEEVAGAAVSSLARFENDEARGMFVEIAKSAAAHKARQEAIFYIAHKGSNEAIDQLMEIYSVSPDIRIKQEILLTLSANNSAYARKRIEQIAASADNARMRQEAIQVIAQHDDEQATQTLVHLYDIHRESETKVEIIFALAQSKHKAALEKLMQIAAHDPKEEMRREAKLQLSRSKDPEVVKFLKDLDK